MGLDAYAGYVKPKKEQPDNVVEIDSSDSFETPHYWRKHARLQQYMMELWHKKKDDIVHRTGAQIKICCKAMTARRFGAEPSFQNKCLTRGYILDHQENKQKTATCRFFPVHRK